MLNPIGACLTVRPTLQSSLWCLFTEQTCDRDCLHTCKTWDSNIRENGADVVIGGWLWTQAFGFDRSVHPFQLHSLSWNLYNQFSCGRLGQECLRIQRMPPFWQVIVFPSYECMTQRDLECFQWSGISAAFPFANVVRKDFSASESSTDPSSQEPGWLSLWGMDSSLCMLGSLISLVSHAFWERFMPQSLLIHFKQSSTIICLISLCIPVYQGTIPMDYLPMIFLFDPEVKNATPASPKHGIDIWTWLR